MRDDYEIRVSFATREQAIQATQLLRSLNPTAYALTVYGRDGRIVWQEAGQILQRLDRP